MATKEQFVCETCKTTFSYYRSTLRGKKGRFCSRKCIKLIPHNKGKFEKLKTSTCKTCNKSFEHYRENKYCSRGCVPAYTENLGEYAKGLRGEKNPFFGKRHTEEFRKKVAGEKHWNWMGDKVGYHALHTWVKSKLGTATQCDYDKTHKSTRFHWANISGSYNRDLNDWAQLCPSCHKAYDSIVKKNTKNIYRFENGSFYERRSL